MSKFRETDVELTPLVQSTPEACYNIVEPPRVQQMDNGSDKSKLLKGVGLALGSAVMFVTSNAIQCYGHHKLTFWQLLFYRSISQTLVMLVVHRLVTCLKKKRPTIEQIVMRDLGFVTSMTLYENTSGFMHFLFGPRQARVKMVLQGIFGALVLLGMYGALAYISLASSTAIFFTAPIFTFILAPCMLKEPCKVYRL